MSYTRKINGAVDGARTRDLHLGKVALYQLSYYRKYKAVRAERLELARLRHWNLNPARLPFRHARIEQKADGNVTHWGLEPQTP